MCHVYLVLHALAHAMQHVYYTFVLVDPLQGAAQDIAKSKKQKKIKNYKKSPTITCSTMNMLSVSCTPCMLHALVHAMLHVYYTFVLADPLQGAAQDIAKSKKQKIKNPEKMPDHYMFTNEHVECVMCTLYDACLCAPPIKNANGF